jgi:hypothetical protein
MLFGSTDEEVEQEKRKVKRMFHRTVKSSRKVQQLLKKKYK